MPTKPTFVIDFDGVIHSYSSGWQGADVVGDPPTPGALAFLREATQHFTVYIYSSRSHAKGGIDAMQDALQRWMEEEAEKTAEVPLTKAVTSRIAEFVMQTLKWPTFKPSAKVTLDDRVMKFEGPRSWPTMDQLKNYRTWWEELASTETTT